jgi:hypothetical protein
LLQVGQDAKGASFRITSFFFSLSVLRTNILTTSFFPIACGLGSPVFNIYGVAAEATRLKQLKSRFESLALCSTKNINIFCQPPPFLQKKNMFFQSTSSVFWLRQIYFVTNRASILIFQPIDHAFFVEYVAAERIVGFTYQISVNKRSVANKARRR